jgi:hypothetical protein
MSPTTSTDWTPTKRSRIVILRENGLFYAKWQDQLVGQSLNLAYESCGYVMEKQNQ